MNKLIIISWVFLLILTSCVSERSLVFIPAGKTVEVDYPDYGLFKVSLKNKGSDDLNIAVLSKESNSQVRGFGLAMRGSADVLVESSNKLVIQNKTEKSIYVKLKVTEESPVINNDDEIYITFTLKNTSSKSIPLIIPSVMNPNLSPFSKSGVSLKIGQELYFKENGRKYLLLTVDKSIEDGGEIDVPALLKKRKAALGL